MRLVEFAACRLILLTGKGGTGKTSVASALGRLGAMEGRRTLVVEIDSQRSALTETFGVQPEYEPTELAPGVWGANLVFGPALVDWLDQTVRAAKVVKLILANHMVQVFLEATPGAREIVVLSKVISLLDDFDQVIVDMPASGHAINLLKVPVTAARLMRSGPINERANQILTALQSKSTALGIIALPEEMVVNETVELYTKLQKLGCDVQVPLVFLNRCAAPTMTEDEHILLHRLSASEDLDPAATELLRAGRWDASLERATADSLGRLHSEIGVGVVPFPRLGVLGGFTGGPVKVVQQMASAMRRRVLAERRSEDA